MIGAKTHAVSALLCAGIGFMRADRDVVKRAVVCTICMICALLHSTTNCFVLHIGLPPSKLYKKYVKKPPTIYIMPQKN